MFTNAQTANLSGLRFINNIDRALKIVSAVKLCYDNSDSLSRVLLLLELYYSGERVTELSFNLHNYTYEDIVDITRNVHSNEFIMHEVDTYLAGEVE